MGRQGLGREFDVAPVIVPVNLSGAAATGLPVSLVDCGGVTFVLFKGAGTAGDDPVITVRESQDAAGTGEQDLDVVTSYVYKGDTSVSGNESWVAATQTAGDIDGDGTLDAEDAGLLAFYIDAGQLSDGFTHVTVDVADVGLNAQVGGVLAIRHDLKVQRAPASLGNTQ
jgi:hypothetical protein